MQISDKNTLLLEEPPKQQSKAVENILNNSCNTSQLERFALALMTWISKYDKVYTTDKYGKKMEKESLKNLTKDSNSKYILAQKLSIIMASKENMQMYIDSMTPELKKLWRTILLHGYVSHDTAKEILGSKKDLFEMKYSYYYYSNSATWNKNEYNWWNIVKLHSANKKEFGYRKNEDYISLLNIVRVLFFSHFFPELQHDSSTDTLPEGQWRTIDMETESLSAFNLFQGLYKQGELPMKKKGISAADIKRADKKMALTEFFPDDSNEYRQFMRANYYLGWLATNEHMKSAYKAKKIMSYADTLLDLFKNFDKMNSYLPAMLYPHIKGLRQNQTEWGKHDTLCKQMMNWMKEHPDKWVSIKDIYMRIVQKDSEDASSIYTAMVYNPNYEQNTADMTNLYSMKGIAADSYTREFGVNGLKAFAFILASLGMAEIALTAKGNVTTETDDEVTSPFDDVCYIRLTPLGRYALGTCKEYEPPVINQEAYFELDPERLIIRSLQDPNPYEQLLRDTAEPISRGRYQTSALSFLTNCRSRNDVEGKISIFKQFIANELPPLWQQFFQSILQHCNPLQEDKISYRHYTIQPDNRDLIKLITTDPVLQQIAIRAEGYRIMVKLEDLRKFETQLKKHGYLL